VVVVARGAVCAWLPLSRSGPYGRGGRRTVALACIVRWPYGGVVVVARRHCHHAVVVAQWLWACVVVVARGKVRASSAQWTCTLGVALCACGSRRAGALGEHGRCPVVTLIARSRRRARALCVRR